MAVHKDRICPSFAGRPSGCPESPASQIDAGQRDGLTTEEHEELRRLRRENRILREERKILKKAAAFFAQETHRSHL